MTSRFVIKDIATALATNRHPTVTMWNRLEGLPRSRDFSRTLRAEVRDGLWMLARQWQLGELTAQDAGSPILAHVDIATTRVTSVEANGGETPLAPGDALEPRVQPRPIELVRGSEPVHLDLRVQLGRMWRRLVETASLPQYLPDYLTRYAFTVPPPSRNAASVHAHVDALQMLTAIAGRCIDGGALYLYLQADPGHRASDGILVTAAAHAQRLDDAGRALVAWFERQYVQPVDGQDAWQPARLEYRFACSAPAVQGTRKRLGVGEHRGRELDWFAFDLDPEDAPARDGDGDARGTIAKSFLPAPVSFRGMPHARWWKLEEQKTSFAKVTPGTDDLAGLLLVEFALVYSNDWFVVPCTMPVGSVATVQSFTVQDSFGERFVIEPSGRGATDNWHLWRMFTLARAAGTGDIDPSLFVPPSSPKIEQGEALEDIRLIRDETANMVWGIEARAPLVTGSARRGDELAHETVQYHQRLIGDAPGPAPAFAAPIAYQAMTTVPEHWIPFVPVHVPGSSREIQLQRAAMLRALERDPVQPPSKVAPQTSLLRVGLESAAPYFVHEEEVPRAGTRLQLQFSRTRTIDTRAVVWLSVARDSGRGEGSSALRFDQLVHAPAEPA